MVRTECFASPLNRNPSNSFCSIFPDTDKCFGEKHHPRCFSFAPRLNLLPAVTREGGHEGAMLIPAARRAWNRVDGEPVRPDIRGGARLPSLFLFSSRTDDLGKSDCWVEKHQVSYQNISENSHGSLFSHRVLYGAKTIYDRASNAAHPIPSPCYRGSFQTGPPYDDEVKLPAFLRSSDMSEPPQKLGFVFG